MNNLSEFSPPDFSYTIKTSAVGHSPVRIVKPWSYFDRVWVYMKNPEFFADPSLANQESSFSKAA